MTSALERARREFAAQPFMRHLGAEMMLVADGRVVIGFDVVPQLSQQHGFVHAGVLSSVMDTACGFAALTTVAEDRTILTAEFKINLLRPATGTRVTVHADTVRRGRTLVVAQATASCTSAAASVPDRADWCALMTATLASVTPPPVQHVDA